MKPIRILFHGFGTFPLFLKPLVLESREKFSHIHWSVVLTTGHHFDLMSELLGKQDVYLLPELMHTFLEESDSTDMLENYQGNIFLDIESDKSPLKKMTANRQIKNAVAVYKSYKHILKMSEATHVLFGHCESHEGKILAAVAEEENIQVISYAHARNLGESFFHTGVIENLPSYNEINEESLSKAEKFVAFFRNNTISAGNIEPIESYTESEIYKAELKPKWKRLIDYIKQLFSEPGIATSYGFYYRFVNSFPLIRDFVWRIRIRIASYSHDINEFSELPEKFIYYPMQYTPESSINIPAPYFVNQGRAIDLIRFNMPSNYKLVIKEHPSCIKVRPVKVMKSLQRCAGVIVADYRMDSRKLVEKSDLTISVTGTATFEAFLLGRPSLNLGDTFFSDLLGGKCGMDELSNRIKKAIKQRLSDKDVTQGIAHIYSITAPFILTSPETGITGRITMSRKNIQVFLEHLSNHIINDASERT